MSESPEVVPVEQPALASGDAVPVEEPKKGSVAYETYLKVLSEKKSMQAKLEAIDAETKAKFEEAAKKKGDYETLLKNREEEIRNLRAEKAANEERMLNAKKLSSVLDAIGGEVDSKWYGLIDVSGIVTNPETGEVDKMSVTKTVEALKKNWPEMIRSVNPVRLPANAPQGNGAGKISYEDWLKLPATEMAKRRKDVVD